MALSDMVMLSDRSVPASAAPAVVLSTLASFAIVVPTLVAYNLPPSATFFNQFSAFLGWGGFLLALGTSIPARAWSRSTGTLALLASMALVFLASIGASLWAAAPWSLSLSSAGTILSAILAIAIGAAARKEGYGQRAFFAVCVAMVIAGVFSSAIGLVQVFASTLPDGDLVAISAIPGRATGNLRQPNHLSSLLLWSIVAAVWLGEARPRWRHAMTLVVVVFIYVVVLSASRTGAMGMLTLAAWGLIDRRLSVRSRVLLVIAPILYGVGWGGTTVWANASHHLFGGQTRFGGSGDISSSRFAIWSNTLSLIAMHPWLGVGFGEFNFAWTLTPFPHRPVAFFDHTHNLVLNFLVELGIPLALVVLVLMGFALWQALRNAIADGRASNVANGAPAPSVQRAAFVIVVMVAVHSMLEYPLWYSYFLLPAAFAFGLCLEPFDVEPRTPAPADASATRPFVLASMALMLGAILALADYTRVVFIFEPFGSERSLEQRISSGRRSVLFAHHADYAAATVTDHPGAVMTAFERAPHYLLDVRLMTAWAKALNETGDVDKASYLAARLKEFRNDQSDEFFAPCSATGSGTPVTLPFQCIAPKRKLRYEDFR